MVKPVINLEQFQALDIRTGTVMEARPAEGVKKPSIWLQIDFGSLGIKSSCAQLSDHYTPAGLIGRQVLAVVNFPPRQIGKHSSEVLVLGGYEPDGSVRLLQPDGVVENGARVS